MVDSVTAEVMQLSQLNPEELLEKWFQYNTKPPRTRQVGFIIRHLAYDIQAAAYGGVSAKLRQRIRAHAPKERDGRKHVLRPGQQLIREYRGEVYRVEILEDDRVKMNDPIHGMRHFPSLSAAASAITGQQNRSGVAFFQLNKVGALGHDDE